MANVPGEPHTFFRKEVGLTEDEIATIGRGQAVVKILPSSTPAEIFVFGAVYINASPEEYARFALDTERVRRLPGYISIGHFSDPPSLSSLGDFTLEAEDIRSLRVCRPGDCGVQLPAKTMREMQSSLDWSRPDIAQKVNTRIQEMAIDLVRRYREGGNSVLGVYFDKDREFNMNEQLRSLLGRSRAISDYLPEVSQYLLDNGSAPRAGVESSIYWEKVDFGLKPTLRINHAIAFRPTVPNGAVQVVAVKQLYASHYLQLAVDLSVCVAENRRPGERGFYLISLKGSVQQGLTGIRGSILRRIVVSRTRFAQERGLTIVKNALEEKKR